MLRSVKKIFCTFLAVLMCFMSIPLQVFTDLDLSLMAKSSFDYSDFESNAEYPEKGLQYWIVFNEGYRSNRLEMSTFDVSEPSSDVHIVWSKSLKAVCDSGNVSKANQFHYEGGEWLYDREYSILSDYATNVIASNVDVYDGDNNLIIKASDNYDLSSADGTDNDEKKEISDTNNEEEDFVKQHLKFANNKFYEDTINKFRFAKTLWENLNSGWSMAGEFVHDITEGFVEVITLNVFDGLDSIKNPYDALLLDFLSTNVSQSFYEDTAKEDSFVISLDIINNVIKMFDNEFMWAEGFDVKKEIEGLLNASDYNGNKLYEKLNTLFAGKGKAEVTAVFQGFECFGKVIGNLTDGLKAVDSFVEMFRYIVAIESFYNSSETFKSLLEDIAAEMYNVNDHYADSFNDTLNKYKSCVNYDAIVDAILDKGIKEGVSLIQGLTSDLLSKTTLAFITKAFNVGIEVAGKINAALWATEVGFGLSNLLTGNDTLVNCRRLLRANYMLDLASYTVMTRNKNTMKSVATLDSAIMYDSAFNFYRNVQLYSLDVYKTYCETTSEKWLSFNKDIFRLELAAIVGRKKLWDRFKCHKDLTDTTEGLRVDTIAVECPTDIYIYRKSDGQLVASVVNNISKSFSDEVAVVCVGDEKAFSCISVDDYDVKIVATGNGTMDVIYNSYINVEVFSDMYFDNIPISKGNSYKLVCEAQSIERDDGINYKVDGEVEGCSCKCHRNKFFSKIAWKIKVFFQKLFKKNKICSCGTVHY